MKTVVIIPIGIHSSGFKMMDLIGTSPVVKWLRLCAPNAGGLGSITSRGTRSHMLPLRPGTVKSINKITIKKKKQTLLI